jgi:cytidylate kinase
MPIITVSRQIGSRGSEISRELANKLGFNFLDKESLEEALAEHGIPELKVEKYDEKKPSFWEIFSSDRDRYLHYLQTVMVDFARRGSCVLLGRGGQVLLADLPGVLRLRIISPPELRVQRIKAFYGWDERHALQMMRHSDNDRAGFHKFFFNVDWESPSLYDLVLNTAAFSVEAACDLLAGLLRSAHMKAKVKQSVPRLEDLDLKLKVEGKILFEDKIPVKFLEIEVKNGEVTLNGTVNVRVMVERCTRAAESVKGVKKVVNQIYFINEVYGYVAHT